VCQSRFSLDAELSSREYNMITGLVASSPALSPQDGGTGPNHPQLSTWVKKSLDFCYTLAGGDF